MPDVLERLRSEHRTIEKVLRVMKVLFVGLEEGRTVGPDVLGQLVQFMRVFCDQCHHGKEESYLFPRLEERGAPADGCPLSALRRDHHSGRSLTDDLAENAAAFIVNENKGRAGLILALRTYVLKYSEHMWKEEFLLFPLAEKVLTPEDFDVLEAQFEEAEGDLGTDVSRAYAKVADELEKRVIERALPPFTMRVPSRVYRRSDGKAAGASGDSAAM